jgi:drug/metabolite transporter (DMT)-like permease
VPTFLLALLSYPSMAAQFAATKLGLQAGLTVWDITVLRYGAAALGALLVFCDPARRALVRAVPMHYAVVGLLGGAVYGGIFTMATAMMPASHSTLFAPSSSIVCTLLVAGLVLGVWPSPGRLLGVGVILAGLVVFARAAGAQFDAGALGGDLIFGLIGLMWGCFGVLARKWNLDPLCCVAVMGATGIFAVPIWLAFAPSGITLANLPIALGEALFQGWFLTFVTFLAYVTLVHRLGPSAAALGIAAVPPLGVAIASVFLGEATHAGQWLGAAIVVAGLVISSGAGLGAIGRAIGVRPKHHGI